MEEPSSSTQETDTSAQNTQPQALSLISETGEEATETGNPDKKVELETSAQDAQPQAQSLMSETDDATIVVKPAKELESSLQASDQITQDLATSFISETYTEVTEVGASDELDKAVQTSTQESRTQETSFISETDNEATEHMELAERAVQTSIRIFDEKVEHALDLDKLALTEEYVQRVEDLDDGITIYDQVTSQTHLNSASFDRTDATEAARFFLDSLTDDGHETSHDDFVLSAPPPTPSTDGSEADGEKPDGGKFSLDFIDRLHEATTTDVQQSEEPAVEINANKERSSAESEGKKTVSTGIGLKKAGFKGSTTEFTGKYPSSYGEIEFEGRDARMTSRDYELEKQQAECSCYAGVEKFATGFVDKIIDKSINDVIANKRMISPSDLLGADEGTLSTMSSMRTYVEIFGTFTRWPRIQEFCTEVGESTINDYMLTWDYYEDWLYCIDFLLVQSDECSDYYFYEAKWSIPSKPYPIPQATASIYFTVEVSRIKPPFCPVDVTYVFEGSRFVHTPGKIQFQEQWLFDIIDAKLQLYKQLRF